MDLVSLGVRIARVATEVAEADGKIVAPMAAALPARIAGHDSITEAQLAGLSVDAADAALKPAAERVASAGLTFERVSRAVRRTAALLQRIEGGWLRRGGSDDRRAMARRQVARSVGRGDHAAGRTARRAERLFDDLSERLDALELEGALDDRPAEVIVAAICRELGGRGARGSAGGAGAAGDSAAHAGWVRRCRAPDRTAPSAQAVHARAEPNPVRVTGVSHTIIAGLDPAIHAV